MEVNIAPQARSDIAGIMAWTEENFGPQTLSRYAKLIATAIEQIAENPDLAGSIQRPEIAQNCRTYHLFFSRKSGGRAGDRVRHPRHFVVYRVTWQVGKSTPRQTGSLSVAVAGTRIYHCYRISTKPLSHRSAAFVDSNADCPYDPVAIS